jgi:predicted anti-sigma-YlaC factor YlaD
MRLARKRDVEALYWTATAWGLAIGGSKDDLQLLGDLPTVEALIARAAELDPDYDDGALHTFLMTYEASRSGISKDSENRARAHFQDAVRVSGGTSASVFVAAAEALSIPEQNRAEFDALIARALAVDVSAKPASRLQNILAQRRARFLLAHAGDYFIEEPATKGQQ